MAIKKSLLNMQKKRSLIGMLFILPWIIGFIFIYGKSMAESIIYSLNNMEVVFGEGFNFEFTGLSHYIYAFRGDPEFMEKLAETFLSLAYEIPAISFYSIFIAMILNQNFKGRTFFRAAFFLPVIITSGVVLDVMMFSSYNTTSLNTASSDYVIRFSGIRSVLYGLGLNVNIVNFLSNLTNRMFETVWKSGIQIIIYLAGLQTIPQSYYEVSTIEGATKWESFWKVTFPLISPFTLIVVIYTIIDSFTRYQNTTMRFILEKAENLLYAYSSALSWIYMLLCGVVIAIIVIPILRHVHYADES